MVATLESTGSRTALESPPATSTAEVTSLVRAVSPVGRGGGAGGPDRSRTPRRVLSLRAARFCGLASFLAFVVGMAVEPVPDGSQPAGVWWADALGLATMVVLLASWIALAVGRRSGLLASAVAGVGLVTLTAACPALAHHQVAGWWWVQLAVGLGITVLSAVMFAGTRAAQPRSRSAA